MSRQENILVIDDDREIRTLLGDYLQKAGYRVRLAADGNGLLKSLRGAEVDLIILDVMLPGDDGVTLCRLLRQQPAPLSRTPVLMLTALSEPVDRILGLEIGADDYLVKPFVPRELLARVRSVLRRCGADGDDGSEGHVASNGTARDVHAPLRFADFTFDTITRELHDGKGERVALTSGEYRLLSIFVRHPNRVLTREQLQDLSQGPDATSLDRAIDVVVSRLRQRLHDDDPGRRLIKTVRGEGYVLATEVRRG